MQCITWHRTVRCMTVTYVQHDAELTASICQGHMLSNA